MRFVTIAALLFVIIALFAAQTEAISQRRRSKEIEDRISKLDEGTKRRIHAMKATGMPKEAIAEKISYVAGGKNIAKRIVEAMHDEPVKKAVSQKPAGAPKPKAVPKAPLAAKSAPAPRKPVGNFQKSIRAKQ